MKLSGRMIAAVAGVALAAAPVPVLAAPAGESGLAPPARAAGVPGGHTGWTAPAGTPPGTVPCPMAKPSKVVKRPPRPKPPAADPALRSVGGDALATAGLAIPPGTHRPPAITASSWLVADLDTGEVLGACGAHEYATPASVQKLLLAAALMARLDPDQVITVTRADMNFEPGSSAVGLLKGGHYTIRTLWLGLLLSSGNDAANVLARVGGGKQGVPGTIAAMNAEARRLGAFQTHAVTPSGLDGPGQFTSAYDLALIARVCLENEDFRRYALTKSAKIPPQPPKDKRGFQIQNQNTLIFEYAGALGGKTGFTDLARHTYVGAAKRNGHRLVATVLGAEARPLRGWQQGAKLLDWGFSLPRGSSVGRLVEPGEVTYPINATPGDSSARPAARGGGTAAGSVSMVQSITGAALLLAAAVPVVLLVVLIRRRRARNRQHPEEPASGWDDVADRSGHPASPRPAATDPKATDPKATDPAATDPEAAWRDVAGRIGQHPGVAPYTKENEPGPHSGGPFQAAAPYQGGGPYQAAAPYQGGGPYQAAAPYQGGGPYQDGDPYRGAGPYQGGGQQPGAGSYGTESPWGRGSG